MTTEKHSSPVVEVPFEVQIITIERDTWVASADGRTTIGKAIDDMVYKAMERGDLIGKVTVDFTEFSKAFVTHPEPFAKAI